MTLPGISINQAFEDVVKLAMELSPEDRHTLAEILWESTEADCDPEVEAAWNAEIRERIRAVEEGREIGIPHEVVIRELEERLGSGNTDRSRAVDSI